LTSFPHAANLKYKKTCGACLAKAAEKRGGKQGQGLNRVDKGNTPLNVPSPVKDIPKDPDLSWEEFITLLCENHESAFELTAFVTLPRKDGSDVPHISLEQAKFISTSI
jgi:hypothetical protein